MAITGHSLSERFSRRGLEVRGPGRSTGRARTRKEVMTMKKHGARSRGAHGGGAAGDPSGRPASFR
jgi:hypothetical protein